MMKKNFVKGMAAVLAAAALTAVFAGCGGNKFSEICIGHPGIG